MNTIEHLPGCDRRHTRRQYCSTAPRPAAVVRTTIDAPVRPVEQPAGSSRSSARFLLFGALLTPVLATGIWVLTSSASNSPALSSELPAWARPRGAVELRNEPGCDENAPWRPPCRSMSFGTDRPYEEVARELQGAFHAQGWSAQFEAHDMSLHAESPFEVRCILFYDASGEPIGSTPDDGGMSAGFDVIINVVLDACGAHW